MRQVITDDLNTLLAVLPPRVHVAIDHLAHPSDLLEIVLDLGRMPVGRFPSGEVLLSDTPITAEDIAYIVERIGQFGDDNRAGIGRTLHRISAIRNRRGAIIGLTCRVGRAIQGTVSLIRDVVEQGKSILILGRPGVGKTTLLREAARVLADDLGKRVVVVDTSNEIAGDGDVPHPGIGRARRMQVARVAAQHQVMIEAVENHMPEVIVIDEIGAELEAQAARTIAERGVQLIGTAHGRTLENLLVNPTLADLVGGIQAVTLGDEEARRRGTQKTVLERKAPPTFDVLVEQEERNLVGVHLDVAAAVDGLLRGDPPQREMRERQPDGALRRWIERAPSQGRSDAVGLPARDGYDARGQRPTRRDTSGGFGAGTRNRGFGGNTGQTSSFPLRAALAGPRPVAPWWEERRAQQPRDPRADWSDAFFGDDYTDNQIAYGGREGAGGWLDPELARSAAMLHAREAEAQRAALQEGSETAERKRRIYAVGVNRNRLEQVIKELNVPAVLSKDEREADILLVLKSMYRKQPDLVDAAQATGMPVFILRSGGVERLRETVADMFHVPGSSPTWAHQANSDDDD